MIDKKKYNAVDQIYIDTWRRKLVSSSMSLVVLGIVLMVLSIQGIAPWWLLVVLSLSFCVNGATLLHAISRYCQVTHVANLNYDRDHAMDQEGAD